ncbi:MAG: hypothetical protein IPG45_26785 [Deltaproteobacteria bacterium]|nr:hypothetical protein [Deltaproteobacteria bacterium]
MSPSLSWIDPGELKETLSRIGISVDGPPAPPPSFRPEPSEDQPSPPPTPNTEASPPPPHFEPVISVAERIDRFARWLEQLTHGAPMSIADPEGLLIEGRGLPEPLALASVALDRALRPIRGLLGTHQVGSVTLEIDGGRLVQTIWVVTPIGRVALGIMVERPLEPGRVELVREGLRRVFDW